MTSLQERFRERFPEIVRSLPRVLAFIEEVVEEERGVMTFKTKEHLEGFIADIRADERQRVTSLIEGLVGGPSEEFGWTGDMYRGYNQALDDLLTHLRSFQESDETYNAEPRDSNETPEVGIQEETLGTAWELDESSGAAFLKETLDKVDKSVGGAVRALGGDERLREGARRFARDFTDTMVELAEETEWEAKKNSSVARFRGMGGKYKGPIQEETEKEGFVPIERGKQYSKVLIEETYDKKGNLLKSTANGVEVFSEKEGASFSGRERDAELRGIARGRLEAFEILHSKFIGSNDMSVLNALEAAQKEILSLPLKETTPQSREQGGECLAFIPGAGGGAVCTRKKPCCVHGEKTNQ